MRGPGYTPNPGTRYPVPTPTPTPSPSTTSTPQGASLFIGLNPRRPGEQRRGESLSSLAGDRLLQDAGVLPVLRRIGVVSAADGDFPISTLADEIFDIVDGLERDLEATAQREIGRLDDVLLVRDVDVSFPKPTVEIFQNGNRIGVSVSDFSIFAHFKLDKSVLPSPISTICGNVDARVSLTVDRIGGEYRPGDGVLVNPISDLRVTDINAKCGNSTVPYYILFGVGGVLFEIDKYVKAFIDEDARFTRELKDIVTDEVGLRDITDTYEVNRFLRVIRGYAEQPKVQRALTALDLAAVFDVLDTADSIFAADSTFEGSGLSLALQLDRPRQKLDIVLGTEALSVRSQQSSYGHMEFTLNVPTGTDEVEIYTDELGYWARRPEGRTLFANGSTYVVRYIQEGTSVAAVATNSLEGSVTSNIVRVGTQPRYTNCQTRNCPSDDERRNR